MNGLADCLDDKTIAFPNVMPYMVHMIACVQSQWNTLRLHHKQQNVKRLSIWKYNQIEQMTHKRDKNFFEAESAYVKVFYDMDYIGVTNIETDIRPYLGMGIEI